MGGKNDHVKKTGLVGNPYVEGTLAELLDAMAGDCQRCSELARAAIDERVERLRSFVGTEMNVESALKVLDGVA